jgi:hypothetical protein
MRAWEEHFDCAVKGAQTLEALRQLQALQAPNQHLATKLASRILALEKRAAKAKRNAAQKATVSIQTSPA